MDCEQRGHMRHNLRAYPPVRGGYGRSGSLAEGLGTDHCAGVSHTPDRSAAALGPACYFLARICSRRAMQPALRGRA
jgi:hypothetical protein